MNRFFCRAILYCVFPALFVLTGPYAFAVETLKVSPASLNLKKGESKNLTLTGKNLRNAKSAVVFLKNSPIKEFTAKLTCKGTTRCVVALTLQGQVAKGEYSVRLFDAKKKLVAEGLFKLSPPSGKAIPRSSRSLRSKTKEAPLAEKTVPRSSRVLKPRSEQVPPSGKKTIPRSSRSLKSQTKQAPLVDKIAPQPSRALKPRPERAKPQSILPLKPEKIRVNPPIVKLTVGKLQTLTITGNKLGDAKSAAVFLGKMQKREFQVKPNCNPIGRCTLGLTLKQKLLPGGYTLQLLNAQKQLIAIGQFRVVSVASPAELAGIKLQKQKAAPGEIVKGSITLTGKAPSPKGVRVALTSSNSKMAKVRPVQIRAGQTKANFSFKTGAVPGTVIIKAILGKKTLTAKLVVTQASFSPVTINKGTFLMTGRRPAPFSPVTINKGTFLMTGRRPAPFTPVTIDKGTFLMTGRRPESAQSPDTLPSFNPVIIDPGTLQMTGRRPAPFTPVTIDPGTLQMTGRRPAPFSPVTIDPGTLEMTGRRVESAENPDIPPSFNPVVITPETLEATGRRFNPVVITPETLEATGRRFNPVVITPETLEATGRRGEPVESTPGMISFKPVIINPGKIQVTGRRPIPFKPIIVNPGKIQVTGRRGEPVQIQ